MQKVRDTRNSVMGHENRNWNSCCQSRFLIYKMSLLMTQSSVRCAISSLLLAVVLQPGCGGGSSNTDAAEGGQSGANEGGRSGANEGGQSGANEGGQSGADAGSPQGGFGGGGTAGS